MKVPISEFAVISLDAPVLPAWEAISAADDSVSWLVWRKFSHTWHRHGAMEGHREAHCSEPTSPYLATGYNLSLRGEWTEAFK